MDVPFQQTEFSGSRQRAATRIVFCFSGIALGSWASLIPLAKERLALGEGALGLLLLSMGIGSLVAMPLTNYATSRLGCRAIITVAAAGLSLIVPILAVAGSALLMALALFMFGLAMGCQSVAMNLQAVLVERHAKRSLMSGFHAFFSLGGILGAACVSGILSIGYSPFSAAICVSLALAMLLVVARPGILAVSDDRAERPPAFAWPKGIVLIIGVFALIAMLCEGAILDWGALFLIQFHGADVASSGLGYVVFSSMMTGGRLLGDGIRTRYGDPAVLAWSAGLATFGFCIALLVSHYIAAIAGFVFMGAGLSNLIPILFTLTGQTRSMPTNLALSSVFTIGYAGIILGPAAIGLAAHLVGLDTAFWMLCAIMGAIAVSARFVTSRL